MFARPNDAITNKFGKMASLGNDCGLGYEKDDIRETSK
jgi:hypothetical protein